MNRQQTLRLLLFPACLCSITITAYAAPLAVNECSFHAIGTTIPNSSGTPVVIDDTTGTVISANFFNSGAIINSPFFDGNEFVSVCVVDPTLNDSVVAEISTDVGLQNDAIIKAYPEFIFGSKFGNLFETSFRYYPNNGLPPEHQWPVTATNLANNGEPFEFANLEYVSAVKGIGLPAFTNNLPQVDITLDTSEENVVGAERDVMLESWFYDTSANAALIGNNAATDQPIANTLNNIVGAGHPHYDQLDNLLLEMMVHIGPLSSNDVSEATRNPGMFQLTEIYSGKDFDGDGIDDHFDVDSHINVNNSQEPQPGKYSSGIDANGDGIDDADILPIAIGDFQYSIWYGTTHLSPLVIYSRETNSSLTSDFDPTIADTNLTAEEEINLNWNLFLDHTLYEIQTLLQLPGVANAPWASGPNNLFDKMRAPSGAIGGLEIGVEPQINNPEDEVYTLKIDKLDVLVDGTQLGIDNDLDNCDTTASCIAITSPPAPGPLTDSAGTETFLWTTIGTGTDYWIYAGATQGSNHYFDSGNLGDINTANITSLPTDGSDVWVRLWYLASDAGNWQYIDELYTSANVPAAPTVISPTTPGPLTDPSGVETFVWNTNGGATEYWIYAGSTQGGKQYLDSGNLGGTNTSNITNLPTDGSDVWVRLWYKFSRAGSWQYIDELYTAASAPSTPALTSPVAPGPLTNSSGTETFTWNTAAGANTDYWIYAGSTQGGRQYFDSGNIGNTNTLTINSLPTDGSDVWMRLFYRVGGTGSWLHIDELYSAANSSTGSTDPSISTTSGNTTLTTPNDSFAWTDPTGAVSEWWLYVGSSLGARDYEDSGNLGSATTYTTQQSTLPTGGMPVYVRLWYRQSGGNWAMIDEVFTSAP